MTQHIALCRIQSNFARNYIPSDKIDPESGARKLMADTVVTLPGAWIDVPDDEAPRLLRLRAIRLPTTEELELHGLAAGAPVRALANGGHNVA